LFLLRTLSKVVADVAYYIFIDNVKVRSWLQSGYAYCSTIAENSITVVMLPFSIVLGVLPVTANI
jgi:hypothetical protein